MDDKSSLLQCRAKRVRTAQKTTLEYLSTLAPNIVRLPCTSFLLFLLLATIAAIVAPSPGLAQPEDLMQQEIEDQLENSVWERGPFYLTPSLRTGIGYDSNAVLTNDAENPDVTASFAPGLKAAIPLGNRVLVNLYEELDFVYYRDLVALRDIFNVTRVGGAIGGKSMVVYIEDEFREEKVRPTREFDVPVDQRSNRLGTSARVSVGWRHELAFTLQRYRVEVFDNDADLTIRGAPVSDVLTRTENNYGVLLSRYVTDQTAALVEFSAARQEFDSKVDERDNSAYGVAGGFRFSPIGNVRGEMGFGYKRLIPDSPTQPAFQGAFGNASVDVGLGDRFTLRGLFLRDTGPSVLSETVYVLSTTYGMSVGIHFNNRFTLRPGIRFGRNTYPGDTDVDGNADETASPDQSPALIRNYRNLSLDFDYPMSPNWRLRVGGLFSKRETTSAIAPEERFVVSAGLSMLF
jgi:hypothetical protein